MCDILPKCKLACNAANRYLSSMVERLTAQVGKIVAKNQKRLLVLARLSTQDLIDEAQTPVAKGGKMRVDTGFLRASGQMSLNGLPSGPIRGEDDVGKDYYKTDETTVVTTLGRLKLGMTVFFGWTANYAKVRNFRDGFRDAAVQNWKQNVKRNAAKIRAYVR